MTSLRIQSIDALRGFAILGILIMNMPFHQNLLTGYVPFEQPLLSDTLIVLLQSVFADGRFRSLFCILFGMGIAIQFASCQRKGLHAIDFLGTRLNWLLLFGILHAVFVFGGDILMLYSITGFLLIKRLELDQAQLLSKAKRHFVIGSIGALLLFIALVSIPSEGPTTRNSADYLDMLELWQSGYGWQMLVQGGFAFLFLLGSPLFVLWQALGLMMIGVYLYRDGFFERGFSPQTVKLILISAVITTALTASAPLLSDKVTSSISPLFSSISALFVALLYAHAIIKVCHSESWLTNMLSACGKVAFTLYLLQSIALALIFRWLIPLLNPEYHAGVTMLDYMLMTLVCWILQIAFALWLRHNGWLGPFERLWRSLYLKSFTKRQAKRDCSSIV